MRHLLKVTRTISCFVLLFCALAICGGNRVCDAADNTSQNIALQTFEPNPLESIYEPAWKDESGFKVSGGYTYRVVNETQKEIEIRKIDTTEAVLTIPEEIDGYRVVCLGYYGNVGDQFDREGQLKIRGSAVDYVKELIIPESVLMIGANSFGWFDKLEKITFPERPLRVDNSAFCGCDSLNNLVLMPNMTVFENAFASCKSLKKVTIKGARILDEALDSDIEEVYVKPGNDNNVSIQFVFGISDIKNVIVSPKVEELYISGFDRVDNLIIDGSHTKVKVLGDYAKGSGMKVKQLITVPNAKCLKWAKENKVNHVEIPNQCKVKAKKSKAGKKYVYSWDKKKLVRTKTTYGDNGKASVKKSNLKVRYAIYEKGKNGKYKKVKVTNKNKWTTSSQGNVRIFAVHINI